MQGKAKSHWERSEESSICMIQQSPQNNILYFKWRLKEGQKRRNPQPALWTECQKFGFRSWNPAEQLAGFQHLGCEIAADGKPESELKVKPEKGCIFEEGRYNCVFIQAVTELCLRDERYYLNWCFKNIGSPKCVSWLVFLHLHLIEVWMYRIISWRYLGESKKH